MYMQIYVSIDIFIGRKFGKGCFVYDFSKGKKKGKIENMEVLVILNQYRLIFILA